MHISERKSLTNMHIYTELYTVVNVSPSNVQIQAFVNYNNIVLHSLGGVVFWSKPFNSAAEVVVSNLRRIRLRSNSTGTKHSSPREQGTPQCFGNQLETPDRQRLSPGRKVPKSASVSTLSLIITPGQTPNIITIAALQKWWFCRLSCFLFNYNLSHIFLPFRQMMGVAACRRAPFPLDHFPLIRHPETPPPTETCHSASAGSAPQSSSTALGRNTASPCRPFVFTWGPVTSTP